jgi:ribonuclease HI
MKYKLIIYMFGGSKGSMSSPRSKRTVSLSKVIKRKKATPSKKRGKISLSPPAPRPKSRISLQKPKFIHQKGIDYVFVDGSTFNNVRKNPFSKGGIGVFFGDNDKRNISEPFYLKPVTNNRCELYACIKAIESYAGSVNLEKSKKSLNIYCDSTYVINSVTKWINKWKYNGWKTTKGTDVENKDLIVWIDKLLQTYCNTISIRFIHVKAHKRMPEDKLSENYFFWYGNNMADRFAVNGSKQSVGGCKN